MLMLLAAIVTLWSAGMCVHVAVTGWRDRAWFPLHVTVIFTLLFLVTTLGCTAMFVRDFL